ncbi:MAG: type II CAAX endopeptidase family protein [Planctomycetota bacterium]|nr:type II CAAX endopeptidase family protein [Planctomycetota bacterium]
MTLPLAGPLTALQDEAAERAGELEKLLENPAALFGAAGAAAVLGLFLVPLRQAIVRGCVAPSPPARASFLWTDLLAVIVGLLLSQVVALQLAVVLVHGGWPEEQEVLDQIVEGFSFLEQAAVTSASFLFVALLIGLFARRRADGFASRGLARVAAARFPLGRAVAGLSSYALAIPFLIAAAVANVAAYAVGGEEVPAQDVALAIQEQIDSYPLQVAFFAVLLIPLLEELIFRGFLLEIFSSKLGAAAGVVLSSFAFAILHGVAAAPVIFTLAVALALVKLRTRSLLVCWLIHGTHNGAVLLLQSLGLE